MNTGMGWEIRGKEEFNAKRDVVRKLEEHERKECEVTVIGWLRLVETLRRAARSINE